MVCVHPPDVKCMCHRHDNASPPAVRQPPTIIKQSLKDHIVDPKDNMVIECEAKGNPQPM